ncbi:LysM and BON domain-containing protein [Roseomonas acroporae]|uniref:LysM and BON domain-containing protein n=1 Tax=Roseomonas acroporae TaxID=2937791 RepID=UPI0024A6C1AB|nr:LysM and BON domain-containing protein [Roseomonas acroporae]
MSLFSFIKGVGRALNETHVGLVRDQPVTAEALKAELARLHLPAEGIGIEVDDDKVILTGRPKDPETREKIVLAVGNVQGVARVEDRMEASKASGNLLDTLSSFSHLPAGSADPIAAGNTVHAATPQRGVAQGTGGSLFYTVHSGDTLSAIAKHFYGDGNAYMRIFEANRPMLHDPNHIYPGQVLRIPPKP